MREIKFRAWDTFQKKYVFEGFHVIGEVTAFGGIDDAVRLTAKERKKGMLEAYGDFVLEQWTGITDKGKRDIYEGDILRLESVWKGNVRTEILQCAWKSDRRHAEFMLADWRGQFSKGMPHTEDCTVIGNIHESPELLK